jgi:hypothetical protein
MYNPYFHAWSVYNFKLQVCQTHMGVRNNMYMPLFQNLQMYRAIQGSSKVVGTSIFGKKKGGK